jgi:hypothetical protein
MKKSFSKWAVLLSATLLLGLSSSVFAQATRTWVSGVGDDANPCSRTAPCKTFAGAISKTAPGGEIDVMDDGGYGGVTITKSITINGGGHVAGVLTGSGTTGILINAGATDVVVLRGLTFTGTSGAVSAVRYLAGKYVVVEDSTIDGYLYGVNMAVGAVNGRMDVRNVQMTNATTAGSYGIHIGPANSITTVSNVSVRGFTYGITTRGGVTYLRGSTIVANDTAYNNLGGSLLSYGDNMVVGNLSDGAPPTGSIPHY